MMTTMKYCCLMFIAVLTALLLVGCGESENTTVESSSLVGLQVEPTNAVIPAGTTQAYRATAIYNDNTTLDVTSKATWSVSDPTDASISTSGLVTGIHSDDEIEKISAVFQEQSVNVDLKVSPAVPVELVITPSSMSLPKGSTIQLLATVIYSDGTTFDASNSENIKWSSNNGALFSVSDTGLVEANIQIKGEGSVIAIYESGDVTVSAQSQVRVTDAIPTALMITPVRLSMAQGTEQSLTAMVSYSDGTQRDVSKATNMIWQSSNDSIVSVSASGLAIANNESNGDVIITGNYSNLGVSISANSSISVTDAIPVSLSVTPSSSTLAQGMSKSFTALVRFSNDSVVDVTQNNNTSWVSSNTSIATANTSTGVVTANSAQRLGEVNIIATFVFGDGNSQSIVVSDNAALSVTQAIPVDLVVLSTKSNIAQGQSAQLKAKLTYSDNSSITISDNPQLSWVSDSNQVASVTQAGLVTANSQQLTGSVLMSATYTDVNLQLTGSQTLTVTEAVPVSLAISASKSQVAQGQSMQLTAKVTYSDNTSTDVTDADQSGIAWSSSNNTLATVTKTGLLTANSLQKSGDITVTATFMDVSIQVVDSTLITITDAVPTQLVVYSNESSIAQGQSSQLSAIVTYSDNTTANVTDGDQNTTSWISEKNELMTVDAQGKVTANVNGQLGQVTIQAIYSHGGVAVQSQVSLTVTQAVPVALSIISEQTTLAQGQSLQLKAMVTYSDNTTADVSDGETVNTSWVSDNNALAIVTNAGALTANSFQQVGDVNISAIYSDAGVKVDANITLSVTQAIPVSMVLSASKKSIAQGQTIQINALVTYSDSSVVDVSDSQLFETSWVSTPESVAKINGQGLLTANSSGLLGEVSVSATYLDVNTRVQASLLLSVTQAIPVQLTLSSEKSSLAQGQTIPLKATVIYSDNTTSDVTQDVDIAWVSENTALAKVDEGGRVTANSEQQVGEVSVMATYLDLGVSVDASIKITVTEAVPIKLVITPTTIDLAQGTTTQLQATVTYSDNSSSDVTTKVSWVNDSVSLVSINNTGLVTANSEQQLGDAQINAKFTDVNVPVEASAIITVTLAIPQRLVVSPSVVSLAQGQSQQYSATVIYSDSTTADFTQASTLSWSSDMTEIATINQQGMVTANSQQKVGSVVISATILDSGISVEGSANLSVTPAVPVSLAMSPDVASIPMGYTQQFYAMMTYSDDSVKDVSDGTAYDISWSSSNNFLASVNNKGLASTLFSEGTGDVIITAKLIDNNVPFETSGVLTVTDPIPTDLEVTPTEASIAQGTTQAFQAWMTYSDGVTREVTNNTNIDWSSDNTTIATVGTTGFEGVVTANKSVNGSTNIIATDTNSGFSGSASLTVTSAVPESLNVTPSNASSYQGQTKQFTATVTYSNDTTYNASKDPKTSWISSNPTIATIDKNGKTTAYLSKGSVDITATYLDGTSYSDTTGLTIKSKTSYPLDCYAEFNDSNTLISGTANTSGDGPTLSRKNNKYAYCLRPDLAGLDITLKAHSGSGCQVSAQKQSGWKTVNGSQFKVTKIIANSCPKYSALYNGY
ncbi:Ig-like domain-containing protein [uncultured Shewanella sp.]|uniref:beta strand repeat-containing protein n=1 Tax=uncultured Shewanella sp. TaxID=173975 RepID=UPI002611DD7C|nr:Ig-like domain-containing protein [uncultured Shewanella sp.]